ncbi:hypothetical protein [Enterococcus faecalis]|uniref:hypothetical protein n=1 Tax=Enterococcus faecalis TaxID=1351 RepID=UPI00293762D0|nr:hypothetical protein [Enterococcus faecalis]
MKKVIYFGAILAGVWVGATDVNASELVDVDTSALDGVSVLKVDDDMLKTGKVEYINNDTIYNITKEGAVIKSLKNIEGFPVLPRAEFNFTLGNGQWWTKSYQIGAVYTRYMTGRQDGGVAQRFQYIANDTTGQYVYYEEVNAGRGGVYMQMPNAGGYTFGMMSRMQNPTAYYAQITF